MNYFDSFAQHMLTACTQISIIWIILCFFNVKYQNISPATFIRDLPENIQMDKWIEIQVPGCSNTSWMPVQSTYCMKQKHKSCKEILKTMLLLICSTMKTSQFFWFQVVAVPLKCSSLYMYTYVRISETLVLRLSHSALLIPPGKLSAETKPCKVLC